jgi:hypothetical protein
VSLLAAAAVEAAGIFPDLFGDVHMSGGALMWMTFAVVPMALAGLLTVLLAWLLWRGQPDGVAVGPLMVAGLLLAEWVAGRARAPRSR